MSWTPADGWKWIFGLLGTAYVLAHTVAPARTRRAKMPPSMALLGLAAGTWIVRRLIVTPGFFQHVGRGADWICLAAQRGDRTYGPGFFEVFGFTSWLAPTRPEHALFEAQAALGACVPVFALLLVRFVGGRPIVAWAFALLVALHPGLARAAASESYYATCTFFLFAGAAAFAIATHGGRTRSSLTWIGSASAGLLLAQAVAIHPVCWLQAACVPLVAFVGPGSLRRRAKMLGIASGCFVLFVGGQLALFFASGTTSHRSNVAGLFWEVLITHGLVVIPLAALVLLLIAVRLTQGLRARLRVLVLGGVAIVQLSLQIAGVLDLPAAGGHSHAFLAAPAIFAAAATLGRARRTARRFVTGLVVAAAAILVPTGPDMLRMTTEALESNWLTQMRQRLPASSVVLFVTQRDVIEMKLPFYGHCGLEGPRPHELERGAPMLEPADVPVYYYRSSLCSTLRGAPYCAEREASLHLRPVARARFPAFSQKKRLRAGRDGMPVIVPMRYREDTVETELSRVLGAR